MESPAEIDAVIIWIELAEPATVFYSKELAPSINPAFGKYKKKKIRVKPPASKGP